MLLHRHALPQAVLLGAIESGLRVDCKHGALEPFDGRSLLCLAAGLQLHPHQQAAFATIASDGYQAVALPYSVKSLTMVVVRPEAIDGVNLGQGLCRRGAPGRLPRRVVVERGRGTVAGLDLT